MQGECGGAGSSPEAKDGVQRVGAIAGVNVPVAKFVTWMPRVLHRSTKLIVPMTFTLFTRHSIATTIEP